MRVQMRRGVKLPPNTRYVGRPSRWGNPFKIGETIVVAGQTIVLDRLVSLALFAVLESAKLVIEPDHLKPLAGADVACYCRLELMASAA